MAYTRGAIVDTDGHGYFFSEFKTTNINRYFGSGSGQTVYCTAKGDNIPVYQIFRDFYGSSEADWENRGSTMYNNEYYYGKVLSITEPINGVIRALILYHTSRTYHNLSERQTEIANGEFTNGEGVLVLRFVETNHTLNSNYTYNKFVFGITPSSYAGPHWANSSYVRDPVMSTHNYIGLFNKPNMRDGMASLATGNTLAFPFHMVTENESNYDVVGICGAIAIGDGLIPRMNFDDIVTSEDPSDASTILRSNCCEGTYQKGYVESGYNGFYFQSDLLSGYEPPQPPPEYPFENDYNGGGGGTGEYTDTSDTVPIDGTPANSAIASGFVNAYLLSQQQVIDFHAYLYSTNFLDNVKKLMNDPIDYILSFMLAPYTPDTSASAYITIGGTNSEVSAMRISSGYKTVDCGTITLREFWGKFYDYNPYTKVQIYLPFIGMRPLDVDDVMSGEVNLKYRIDVLTGACVATISVNNARGTNGAVYNFNGNCHSHIPISGKNYLETVTNVLQAGVGMAGSIASGNALGVASGAINVMRSAKEQLEHAGELTGAAGLLANFTPFLMVSRPSQSLAQNYNHYKGFISNVTAQLGTLSGYTEVAELVQTDIHCTLDEFDEINELLKEGVYL